MKKTAKLADSMAHSNEVGIIIALPPPYENRDRKVKWLGRIIQGVHICPLGIPYSDSIPHGAKTESTMPSDSQLRRTSFIFVSFLLFLAQ